MEQVLETNIATADLKKFEEAYHLQLSESRVTPQLQFEYAWCLVQSCYNGDIAKGILLLENLLETSNIAVQGRRDYLFYLAFGQTRLKEYNKARSYLQQLMRLEPGNQQASDLMQLVSQRLRKERMKGALVTGGTVLAVGGALGVLSSTSLLGFGCRALAQLAPLALTLARR